MAHASPNSAVAVTRDPGTEDCPDGAALADRVRSMRGEARGDPAASYDVRFTLDERGLSASIRASGSTSARVLRDRGPSCSALAQATAVTLALLLDSDAAETPEPAPALVVASVPPADELPETPILEEPSRARATFSLGGGVLAGVIAPVVPAFTADAGIELLRFRTSVGALAVFPQTTELAPGVVRQSLVTGFARSCLAPYRDRRLRFDVCSGVYAGVLKGEGSGYTRNESASTPWLALPFELALHSVSPGFGWELGAAALVPIRRHDFEVDGVGVAYASPAIAGLLSLRAVGLWAL
jgi:hypothetical protein